MKNVTHKQGVNEFVRPIDFGQLNKIYNSARKADVGFALVYAESDGSWYFSINSSAPSEQWIGKNRPFESACESVLKRINELSV